MKFTCSLFLFVLITFYSLGQSNSISKHQILEDLDFLYQSLEEAHYDLYAYTPKQDFEENFQAVKQTIQKDSFSLLETTNLLQRVISKANIGHTNIDFPLQSYIEYAKAGGTVFPLEIAFENDKALIRKNWSSIKEIAIGSEIISINGIPLEDILTKIYPQISAESLYFKKAKIELYSFPRFYWQVFEEQKSFEVQILKEGTTINYTLDAISIFEEYEGKRKEIILPAMELRFIEEVAYLNPGGFGGDENQYRHFIDSAFSEINVKKSQSLIIDLRNNPGGDDSFSDYLVSYVADKPFYWNSSYTLKTTAFLKKHIQSNYDTTKTFWQKALQEPDGAVYKYDFEKYQPQPKSKRFKGRVYALVNRQSHSQSTVAAAQLQDYNFATIVGEETGEFASLYASIFQYNLPNTSISVNVSKGYMVRVNGDERQKGVVPDIFIKDFLLDESDEILEGLLTKIKKME